MKKGGAAKGELVLAIYELANCFRYGWGVAKDPVAARQYYETAANLGDTDAMNEAAWCFNEGVGGKKDRVSAAVRFICVLYQGFADNERFSILLQSITVLQKRTEVRPLETVGK